jgi:hypothetical protein
MKRKITLMSVMLASISVSFGQNQKAITTFSTLAPQELATEMIEKPTSSSTSFEKAGGDVIWLNEFSDANDWTAAGPGANYTENGWSIGATTNTWYTSAIQSTMNTTGAFARFRNGVPPSSTSDGTVISDGPFTLTYNSTIDLTGVPAPLLEFEQYGARFIELQALQISLNGTDWVTVGTNDDIAPLTASGGSVYNRPMTRRYSLAPHLTGDISAVHVRILWNGAMNGENMNYIAYGWYVDNIRIIEGFENYAVIEEAFATMGQAELQYTKIPTTQVTSNNKVGFGAWAKNLGSQEQSLRIVASNSNGSVQSSFGIVGSQERDSIFIPVADGWEIPAQTGLYNFTVKVENDALEIGAVHSVDPTSLVAGTGYTSGTYSTSTNGDGVDLTVDITAESIGDVTAIVLSTEGSNYTDATNVATTGENGTGLTVDVTAETIGEVTNITLSTDGSDYVDATDVATTGGNGTGLTLAITTESGMVTEIEVLDGGTGYNIDDVITIDGGNLDATITVTEVTNGAILSVAINNAGTGYAVDDEITIDGGNLDATFTVTEVTNGAILSVIINNAGTGYAVDDVITVLNGDENGTITVLSIGELIQDNANTFSHPFEVTTKVMAVDKYNGTNASITGAFTGWAGNQSDPGIGTDFEIFVDAELERVQVGIAAIPSASQAQYVGNELFCQMWKFNESTGWELIAISMFKTLASGDFGKLVNLQFEEPIQLQAGDIILPIASFFTGATVPIALAGNSIRGTTTGIGNGGLIGLAGTGNFVSAPVVRLDFGTYLNIEESAIEAMNVTLYPNPTSNNATIAYTLNTASKVSIEVRDLSGKLVYSANENQVAGAQTLTIATDKFAEGMYTYTLTANGSQVTKKFIVKK